MTTVRVCWSDHYELIGKNGDLVVILGSKSDGKFDTIE